MSTHRPKPDDPEQSQRFIDMAREVEADEDPKAFERAFRKVIADAPLPSTKLQEK